MALFGQGKTDEEKSLEKIAKALDSMRRKEPNGCLHAGCFGMGVLFDANDASLVVEGVLEFLQKNGREVVDVKPCLSDSYGMVFTVLYR